MNAQQQMQKKMWSVGWSEALGIAAASFGAAALADVISWGYTKVMIRIKG